MDAVARAPRACVVVSVPAAADGQTPDADDVTGAAIDVCKWLVHAHGVRLQDRHVHLDVEGPRDVARWGEELQEGDLYVMYFAGSSSCCAPRADGLYETYLHTASDVVSLEALWEALAALRCRSVVVLDCRGPLSSHAPFDTAVAARGQEGRVLLLASTACATHRAASSEESSLVFARVLLAALAAEAGGGPFTYRQLWRRTQRAADAAIAARGDALPQRVFGVHGALAGARIDVAMPTEDEDDDA